jgi:hypothetical protein
MVEIAAEIEPKRIDVLVESARRLILPKTCSNLLALN